MLNYAITGILLLLGALGLLLLLLPDLEQEQRAARAEAQRQAFRDAQHRAEHERARLRALTEISRSVNRRVQ
jgi:hypothetical protein